MLLRRYSFRPRRDTHIDRSLTEHLTSSDVRGACRAIELLLAPLDHDSVDQWRSDVNRTLSDLLGADSAGFILPGVDGPIVYSDEHDAAELAKYPEILPPALPGGEMIFSRAVRLGPCTLPELWGNEYGEYLKSPYHNEFALANDADDAITAVMDLPGEHPLPVAGLHFWHGRDTTRRFGSRELALVRMVYPAMRTGIETQIRWGRHRLDLIQTLDCLEHPTAVFDAAGRLLHFTPAFQALVDEDPEKERLEGAVAAAARRIRVLGEDPRAAAACQLDCSSAGVRTNFATYRLTATTHRSPLSHSASLTLVALRRTTPVMRTQEDLRATYSLTAAEARVAVHLVSSRSSAEIARDLCVTVHTVRRHTEKILLKAGVRSRTELATRLLR